MGYQAGMVLSDNLFDSNHLALQLGTQGQRKVTCLGIGDRARAGACSTFSLIVPREPSSRAISASGVWDFVTWVPGNENSDSHIVHNPGK